MSNSEEIATAKANALIKWQTSLLPFMTKTLIFLAIFFFTITIVQLYFLQKNIMNNPKINVIEPLRQLSNDTDHSHAALVENQRLKMMVILEAGSVENQFHQAKLSLMSRVWITYVGFVTGMIMAMVGSVFILGKLSTSMASVAADMGANKISISSTSPGLILAFLGTILLACALVINHRINSTYTSIYIKDNDLIRSNKLVDSLPALRYDTTMFLNK